MNDRKKYLSMLQLDSLKRMECEVAFLFTNWRYKKPDCSKTRVSTKIFERIDKRDLITRDCEIFYADKNLQEIYGIIGAFFDDSCHLKEVPHTSVRKVWEGAFFFFYESDQGYIILKLKMMSAF